MACMIKWLCSNFKSIDNNYIIISNKLIFLKKIIISICQYMQNISIFNNLKILASTILIHLFEVSIQL